uniref:30S ribosomal protein S9 n=1 Tax=Choreocolax polysiphoniae TaxID=282351 RepID=A0A0B5W5I2_9FLOR|nr:30S ribosomal protein S9 [Choreocolax polysiphoniae]AJH65851.1 30S ribosomal protein S9 [Choreocolax polysiphoniae]
MSILYNNKIIYLGTGKRKTSIAQVKLISGSGKLIINGLSGELYLQFSPNYLKISFEPLNILGLNKEYDVYVKVLGGGLAGQANSIKLGLARALCYLDIEHKLMLNSKKLLKRDARIKEKKKYGLCKARKSPQYSKR